MSGGNYFRIIPCLDVDKGLVVKGVRFQDLKRAGDPVELAARYEEEGADELVFLDITASVEGRKPFLRLISDVASVIRIPFTVGGGVSSIKDVEELLSHGADKVSINTAAVKDPALITRAAEEFGSQAIVVAIDAKRVGDGWEVYIYGGREPTGLDAVEWAVKAWRLGAGELLVTSIDRDGTRLGYDIELIREIASRVGVPVIASGGAGEPRHFLEAYNAGAEAGLAAGIFHYRLVSIRDVKEYLRMNGVPVRGV